MRSLLGAATFPILLLSVVSGCSKCSSSTTIAPADAAPPEPAEVHHIEVLPPPTAWKFDLVRLGPTVPGTALPQGCRMREPLVRAKVRPSTKFVAAPSALATLLIADADTSETPPRLVGVAAMQLDPAGTSTNAVAVPWLDAAAMPRLSRAKSGAWLAAYAEAAEDKLSQVFVFQNGGATPIGTGEKFDALDMNCDDERCLLLTTRLGRVYAAGADVWMGKSDEPATSWRKVEIVPAAGESDARPSCIARMNVALTDGDAAARRGPVVALLEGSELVFWGVPDAESPHEIGRVSAPHGIVDATVLGRPVAFTYGAPVDEEGCARQGGIMHFSRVGAPDVEVRAHAPATYGALRPLARGGLAAYIAPVGCGATRKVVYAVVLDDEGAPISAPMPVSDAASFAIATQGENVDLWIQRDEEVVWARATCSAP